MTRQAASYLTLPKANQNDTASTKLAAKYGWTYLDDEKQQDVTVEPTFADINLSPKNRLNNHNVYRKFNGEEYLIIVCELSDLEGERREIKNLGIGKDKPNFTI